MPGYQSTSKARLSAHRVSRASSSGPNPAGFTSTVTVAQLRTTTIRSPTPSCPVRLSASANDRTVRTLPRGGIASQRVTARMPDVSSRPRYAS